MFHQFMRESDLSNATFVMAALQKKTALSRHISSVHEGIKPFKCNICEAKFARKSHLNSHSTSVHERKKQPLLCRKKTL